MRYPKIFAAAKEADFSLWGIARALIEETGPNGPMEQLKDVSAELAEFGIHHTAERLAEIRRVGVAFLPDNMHPQLVFSIHAKARTPEILNKIIETSPDRITVKVVDDFLAAMKADEEAEAEEVSAASAATPPPKGQETRASGLPPVRKGRLADNFDRQKTNGDMKRAWQALKIAKGSLDADFIHGVRASVLEKYAKMVVECNEWTNVMLRLIAEETGKQPGATAGVAQEERRVD